jgi:hypothetical protein
MGVTGNNGVPTIDRRKGVHNDKVRIPSFRRRRSPHSLTYGLYRALLVVAILVIPSCFEPMLREEAQRLILERAQPHTFGAPSIPNTLPAQQVSYQAAPPTASGAEPLYPLNHTFDADPIPLGSAPNTDFETAGSTVGTPPSNYDFASAPPTSAPHRPTTTLPAA